VLFIAEDLFLWESWWWSRTAFWLPHRY